jgi:uncharacterized membrane protein
MRNDGHDFARLTNLADGIFAVAMTFLAFTIQVPAPGVGPDGALTQRLGAMLPQFGTLAFSFCVAARIWLVHFKMHGVIRRGDNVLLVFNLVLLFGIVLIPFTSDVLSTYPISPLNVSIYATNALVMLTTECAIWRYARTHPHFLAEATSPDYPARMMRSSLQIAAVFGTSIAVAWFAPRVAICLWALVPLIVVAQAHTARPRQVLS